MKSFLGWVGLGIFIVMCVGACRMSNDKPFFPPSHPAVETGK
jgi:hypothetical protein